MYSIQLCGIWNHLSEQLIILLFDYIAPDTDYSWDELSALAGLWTTANFPESHPSLTTSVLFFEAIAAGKIKALLVDEQGQSVWDNVVKADNVELCLFGARGLC
jgi:hypothetical protein